MKPITSLSLLFLAATLLPVFSVQAEQTIMFKPPQLGAPETRVGGGTRGISGLKKQAPSVQLLASKQIGLSSVSAPTLYWYTAKGLSDKVKLTVRLDYNEPLLEKNIDTATSAGIQTIHLADYEINLEAEKDYTWSISVAGDVKATGKIRYTPPATPLTDAAQMAEAGYWYDTVNQLIETKSPQLDAFLLREGINIKP